MSSNYFTRFKMIFYAPITMIRTLHFILFLLIFNNGLAQEFLVDSLLNELATTKEDTSKIKQLLNIATAYHNLNLDKSIDYNQQAVTLSKSIGSQYYSHAALRALSNTYFTKGEFTHAMLVQEELLAFAQKSKKENWIRSALNGKAVILYEKGAYANALTILYQCLEKTTNQEDVAKLLTNISFNQEKNGDYKQALINAKTALSIYQEIGDKKNIASMMLNLGVRFWNNELLDSAIVYNKKALSFAEELDNTAQRAKALSNLGGIYTEKRDFERARKYLFAALEIDKKLGDKFGIAYGFLSLGDLAQEEAIYSRSNDYYLKSLVMFQEIGAKFEEKEIYVALAENYAALGNYKEAYTAQTTYQELNSKLYTQQKDKQIQELAAKYESEKKEANIELLKVQQSKQALEIKQKNILSAVLVGILGLLVVYIFKRKKNKLINEQRLQREIRILKENIDNKEMIEQQAKKLHLIESQKNKLFTNIAHELQTPLNIIYGLGMELFKSANLKHSEKEALAIVTRNTKNLSSTAHQILEINKSNGQLVNSKIVNFYLLELLQSIISEYHFLAKQKNSKLTIDPSIEATLLICSDVYKLETILKNLLSNAIKYLQKEGAIQIAYQLTTEGFHQIKVIDNGPGITKQNLPLLFDRYYQTDTTNPEGGFGIGLTICKDYIESLDGTIEVDSTLGLGTTFTITFPKKPVLDSKKSIHKFPQPAKFEEQVNTVPIPLVAPTPQSAATLLIVEDNYDYCKYLETILVSEYQLKFVHDGAEAIKCVEKELPDLIITDGMMPNMDGFTFVEQLKFSGYSSVPILMLTARNLKIDKLKALRLGIDDYLTKPVETDNLKNSITKLLQLKTEKPSNLIELTAEQFQLELSVTNQDWLMKLEKNLFPLIYSFDLKLEQIAELMNISSKQLNVRLKEITGLTAKKYIQEIRYWEARRMLETRTHDSVKAVSYSVGFKDTKNFSRRFKERFGKYPTEYMK